MRRPAGTALPGDGYGAELESWFLPAKAQLLVKKRRRLPPVRSCSTEILVMP